MVPHPVSQNPYLHTTTIVLTKQMPNTFNVYIHLGSVSIFIVVMPILMQMTDTRNQNAIRHFVNIPDLYRFLSTL